MNEPKSVFKKQPLNVFRSLLALIVLIAALSGSSHAQQHSSVGIIPEVRVNYGFITSDKDVKPYVKDRYFPLFEISFNKETYGLERYEILYNYPRKGIDIFYTEFGQKELFGTAVGAFPFLNFPLIKDNKVYTWVRVGVGACYFTKRFNIDGVIPGKAPGPKLNGLINISPSMGYSPTKRMTFFGGISFFHITNAGFTPTPYFFNSFTGFIGYSLVIKKGTVTPQAEPLASPRNKWKTTIMAGAGFRQVNTEPKKVYTPATLSISATRWLSKKSRFGFTGDVFYDPSIPPRIMLGYKPVPAGLIELREGIALNYTWVVGNLEVPLDFGVYLFPAYVNDGSFYNRYGLRFFPQKNFFLNFTVKSHFFKPDHLEAGLGVAF